MQVVLLAAGAGLRLGHLTRSLPKALVEVTGRPLIDFTLPHLLASKRVEEVIVVGGFEYENLRRHVLSTYEIFGDRVRVVENRRFLSGNLYSMQAALPFIDHPFLLCNVDHLYSAETWKEILNERREISIFCDFHRKLADDEMKVLVNGQGYLKEIAKSLKAYNAGYVGLSYFPKSSLKLYQKTLKNTFDQFGDQAVVENVLGMLAAQSLSIHLLPFDQHVWYEVDTPEDLARVKSCYATPVVDSGLEQMMAIS